MRRLQRVSAMMSVAVLAACASAGTEGTSSTPAAGGGSLANMVFMANVPPGSVQQSGEWQLTFNEHGRVLAHHEGRLVYEGDYVVSSNELRITNRAGNYGCGGRAAVYAWTLQDRRLTLRRRDDPCTTIAAIFPIAQWERR